MTTPDLAGLCERLRASWSARGWSAAKKIDAMIHLEREAAAAIESLVAALDRIADISGDRAAPGFNEAGRLSRINEIARTALEGASDDR